MGLMKYSSFKELKKQVMQKCLRKEVKKKSLKLPKKYFLFN